MTAGLGVFEREDVLVHKCNVRIAELENALKMLMEWQVKNVDKWHNSAYDSASAVLEKGL